MRGTAGAWTTASKSTAKLQRPFQSPIWPCVKIYRLAEGDEISVERMWVAVRERIPGGYLGILDNEPDAISENGEFWLGAELPFEYRHIIDVTDATDEGKALAIAPPAIPWDRG